MSEASSAAKAGIRLERNVTIPLADGVELAADALMPEGDGPFPTLLSFYPYHKDGITGISYGPWAERFAEHGYASLLVDVRGTGSSSGEPAPPLNAVQDGKDGAEAVEWAAAQPWCDGNVGVYGMSYGGFSSLSTAAQRPAALKAIVAVHGPPDPYSEINFIGGSETCRFQATWSALMLAIQLSPPSCPDPDGRWRRRWQERLETRDPWLLPWRLHPDYDDYWQRRSIDLESIEVPTFLIGGWRDLFPSAATRAYERIPATRRMLVGPWTHEILNPSVEPIDEHAEMRRWFDRWLRGVEDDDGSEPPVTFHVQGAGIWRREEDWPPTGTSEEVVYLNADGGIDEAPSGTGASTSYTTDPTVGVRAGHGEREGEPLEQGEDDERSLAYIGAPLTEPLEFIGSPEAVLHVALEQGEDATFMVRLCDIAPSGESTLITKGWAKLSHRESRERPKLAKPGEMVELHVPLDATSYSLAAGHRLRVGISCADFPTVWPMPENPKIALHTGGERASHLRFETVAAGVPPAEPPIRRAVEDGETVAQNADNTMVRDPATGDVELFISREGEAMNPGGEAFFFRQACTQSVAVDDPGTAHFTGAITIRQQLADGAGAVIETSSELTHSTMQYSGRVTIDDEVVYEREWTDHTSLDSGA